MNEVNVVPAEINAHSAELAGLVSQMSQAESAAGTALSLSPQAFGILCSFFTAPCLAMSSMAITSMTGIGSRLDHYAGVLTEVAADFESTDSSVSSDLTNLKGRLA